MVGQEAEEVWSSPLLSSPHLSFLLSSPLLSSPLLSSRRVRKAAGLGGEAGGKANGRVSACAVAELRCGARRRGQSGEAGREERGGAAHENVRLSANMPLLTSDLARWPKLRSAEAVTRHPHTFMAMNHKKSAL